MGRHKLTSLLLSLPLIFASLGSGAQNHPLHIKPYPTLEHSVELDCTRKKIPQQYPFVDYISQPLIGQRDLLARNPFGQLSCLRKYFYEIFADETDNINAIKTEDLFIKTESLLTQHGSYLALSAKTRVYYYRFAVDSFKFFGDEGVLYAYANYSEDIDKYNFSRRQMTQIRVQQTGLDFLDTTVPHLAVSMERIDTGRDILRLWGYEFVPNNPTYNIRNVGAYSDTLIGKELAVAFNGLLKIAENRAQSHAQSN